MVRRMLFGVAFPLTLVSLLLLGFSVVASVSLLSLHSNVSDDLADHVSGVRAAEGLEIGIREVRSHLNYYLHTQKARHLHNALENCLNTSTSLERAEQVATSEEEKQWITQVRRGYDDLLTRLEKVTAEGSTVDHTAEVTYMTETLIGKQILPPAHQYLFFNEKTAEQASRENQRMARRLGRKLLLLGTSGAVAGLMAGYTFTRRFNRSIIEMNVPIQHVAGKLNEVVGPITFSSKLEFSDLEGTLHRIASEITKVVERLQKSEREVLRREQLAALGHLAAGMAHELRNPLMAMKVLVQSANEASGEGGLCGHDLGIVEEEIRRMEESIQTFLDFARPPRLEKRRFEARLVFEQTLTLVAARAEKQGVVVESELPEEPVFLDADIGQFRQVLLNLLFNALDAIPAGGGISVRMKVGKQAGDPVVTLEVSDSGPGLPSAMVERIFEPFVTSKETGTGLGLSICKQIVEAHGGTIEARNRSGSGAVFTVRLPLAPAVLPEPASTSS